ncbi:MAG: LuxR C-terminal-related transcriptional regulator [Vicinamibacterales bacterium]
MIRILVADDVPIVREGFAGLVRAEPDMEVCGTASTAAAVANRVREIQPRVVVLGFMSTGRGGLEALQDLRRRGPEPRILVFNSLQDDSLAVRAIRAGADGYLARGAGAAEITHAIRETAAGRRFTSPSAGVHLAAVLAGEAVRPLHEELSDREFQVLRQLSEGFTLTEVADHLSLSVKTVSTYRARVLAKLGVRTTAGLIRYALENHVV